jgi:two-component system response regulator YesN
MERAGSLLTTTDMAVEQVAFLCGYEHLGNFYRVFKAHFGVTPGVYGRGGGDGACVAQKPMSLPCAS